MICTNDEVFLIFLEVKVMVMYTVGHIKTCHLCCCDLFLNS